MSTVCTIESVDQFKSLVKRDKITAIQISLEACGGCKQTAPTFSKLAGELTNAEFYKMSGDDFEDFMEEIDVQGYPNFRVYRNNELLLNYVGSKSDKVEAQIKEAVSKA